MFCTNCGAEVPDGTRFCTSCGAALTTEPPSPDKTVSMPSVAQGPAPAYDSARVDAPVAPAPSPAQGQAPRHSGGSSVVAVVMSLVALVAVAALVVVVLDPFGSPDAQQTAETQQEQPAQGEEDDEAPEDDADDASDDAADATTDDQSAQGGDNNVVVMVDSKDSPSRPDTVVVHESDGSYVLADSSTRAYTAGELDHLSDWELYLARNEIYARHGRRFNNEDLQRYFDSQPWYTPLYSPEDFDARSGSILNGVERENATTILSVEQSRGSQYI